MIKVLLLLLLFPLIAMANDEPGGWVEPGGYDPVAEAKMQRRRDEYAREMRQMQLADIAKKEKIESAKKAAANKIKQEKLIAYQKSPEYFKKLSDTELCTKSGILERKNSNEVNVAYAEISRRNLLYTIKLPSVIKREITIGMSDCELLASWGPAIKINKHVSANRIHKQYVYSAIYVYTDNGIITSWQE